MCNQAVERGAPFSLAITTTVTLPTLQKSFSAVHTVQLERAAHLDQLGRNSDTMPAARYEHLSNPRLATFDFANLLLCKKGAFKLKTLPKRAGITTGF